MTRADPSSTAPPRRRLLSQLRGRRRALLCLTAVAALAAATGVQSTLAAFTNNAAISGATFSSGTVDVTLWDDYAGPANIDANWDLSSVFLLTTAAPGEAGAIGIKLTNAGTLPLVYDVVGTATGALATSTGMRYYVKAGNTIPDIVSTSSGAAGENNRGVSCGGTAVTDALTSAVTSTGTTFVSSQSLAVGTSRFFCIAYRLSNDAGNGLQGATSVAKFKFAARQVD